MFKKITFAVLITILASAAVVGLVSAQEKFGGEMSPDFHPKQRGLLGQIVEIGEDQFDVESLNGDLHTIMVSDETRYRSRQGEEPEEAGFEDLEVGMWVAIHKPIQDSGARLVVLLPEDFDPSNLPKVRVIGEVDKINQGQKTFDLITRNGEELSFQADDQTRFAGEISSFSELEKGMVVGVLAAEQEDGTLLAKLVATPKPKHRPHKLGGKISQIGEDTLTIMPREGEDQIFSVTDETRFLSRQGEINGLEDLETGMIVMIVFNPQDNPYQALAVLVADPAMLALERIHGEVQSAGGSHLTINAGDETIKFDVDENTRIRGRGVQELNDLKNGMKVVVLYTEQEDGSLLAKGILAGGR